MLTLIDLCGCPGFKLAKGSTPYLVIGMVTFKDFIEAEKVSNTIKKLKKTLNIKTEFKFNKTNIKTQEAFFEAICHYNFEIRALIADKIGINDSRLRSDTNLFYEYLITTLLQNNVDLLSNASLKINHHVDRKFRDIFKKQLHEKVHEINLKKYQFCDSENDSLIQLTDMLVGIISKNFTDESLLSTQLVDKLVENKKIKSIWRLRESS